MNDENEMMKTAMSVDIKFHIMQNTTAHLSRDKIIIFKSI